MSKGRRPERRTQGPTALGGRKSTPWEETEAPNGKPPPQRLIPSSEQGGPGAGVGTEAAEAPRPVWNAQGTPTHPSQLESGHRRPVPPTLQEPTGLGGGERGSGRWGGRWDWAPRRGGGHGQW